MNGKNPGNLICVNPEDPDQTQRRYSDPDPRSLQHFFVHKSYTEYINMFERQISVRNTEEENLHSNQVHANHESLDQNSRKVF